MREWVWVVVIAGACGGGNGGASDGAVHDRFDFDAPTDAADPNATPWTNRSPTPLPDPWPSGRDGHGLAFDPVRGVTVMFGGADVPPTDATITDELWEWDGAAGAWANRTPTPRPALWPPTSFAPSVTYDAGRGRTFVYGGLGPPAESTFDRHVWEWDGAAGTWADRTPSPLPESWPPDGELASVVYDPDRAVVVAVLGDQSLWEWDGATGTWADRTPSPLPPAWPIGRNNPGLTYDAAAHRTLMFGGRRLQDDLGDLWAWDGAGGTWTELTPSPLPPAWPDGRTKAVLSFDPDTGVSELYGGINDSNTFLTDLWAWDGAAGTWTDRTPATLPDEWPAEHLGAAMVYDSTRHRQVMFGGVLVGDVAAQDLWDLKD